MNWRPKNIRESVYPLLILNWITGLGFNDYPIGNKRNYLFLIPIFIITSLFWCITYVNIQSFSIAFKDVQNHLFPITLLLNTMAATSAMIYGWFNRQRMYKLTESMQSVDDCFEYLGLRQNYCKTFKRLVVLIIVYLILICMTELIYFKETSRFFISLLPFYTTTVVDISINFCIK
ncbi:uncharacterized protein LOC127285819 [Leptopilina boulardi]|uniref:uncharacterized protein LOC127285819 n=1 Tax=Leptopilina boulardi TaxID=63433 RepID=UPI0021F567AA|nr:uncharacterized protein LOC127285819 [Leptopilina boulardi]